MLEDYIEPAALYLLDEPEVSLCPNQRQEQIHPVFVLDNILQVEYNKK